MIITTKLRMDLQNPGITPMVHAVQTDTYSRNLEVELFSGRTPFPFPETGRVVIRFRKFDGRGGEYDTLPDGTPAWSVRKNVLTLALAPQVLTAPGSVAVSVSILDGDTQLSLFPVQLNVQPVAAATIAKSENYFYVLRTLPAPASAQCGQLLRVAAVDETGNVTQMEAVDPEELSGSSPAGTGLEPEAWDIPRVFLDGEIPTTKSPVPAVMRYVSATRTFTAWLNINCQGTSSMSYPKKNFTVELYKDEEHTQPLTQDFRGWGAQNTFCLKANYIDHSHARNIVSARLWSETIRSREDYDNLPEALRSSPNNGAVDGFPVKVYTNGTYQGIYTWNIPKGGWMWNMDEANPNHILLCAEAQGGTSCDFTMLWDGTDGGDWSVEAGTHSPAVTKALNDLITCVKDTDDDTFRATIGNFLDLQSAMDYYIHQMVIYGKDNLAKNMLLATYDGKKWFCGAYDMDSTYGLEWDGSTFFSADKVSFSAFNCSTSLLWQRLSTLFSQEIADRYLVLRDTVYGLFHMFCSFETFMDTIGPQLYAEDLQIYPGIPQPDTNNIRQLRDFIRDRRSFADARLIPSRPLYHLAKEVTLDGTNWISTGVDTSTMSDYTILLDYTITDPECVGSRTYVLIDNRNHVDGQGWDIRYSSGVKHGRVSNKGGWIDFLPHERSCTDPTGLRNKIAVRLANGEITTLFSTRGTPNGLSVDTTKITVGDILHDVTIGGELIMQGNEPFNRTKAIIHGCTIWGTALSDEAIKEYLQS